MPKQAMNLIVLFGVKHVYVVEQINCRFPPLLFSHKKKKKAKKNRKVDATRDQQFSTIYNQPKDNNMNMYESKFNSDCSKLLRQNILTWI